MPGPSDYHLKMIHWRIPAAVIPKSHSVENSKFHDVPGPGSYQAE